MSTDDTKTEEKAPQKHATLAAALVAAQREAEDGPKADGRYQGKGKQSGVEVGFNYPKPETSIPWMKAVLNRHGLAFTPGGSLDGLDVARAPVPLPGGEVLIPLSYALEHESGARRSWTTWAPIFIPYGGTLMRGTKSAWTGTLKFQLMDVLGCRTENDDDEMGHGPVPTAAGRKAEEGPPPPVISAPVPQQAPPPVPGGGAPRPLPAPAPAASAAGVPTTASASAPAPLPQPPATTPSLPVSDTNGSSFDAVMNEHKQARIEKMTAAARAAGMPGLATTQYVIESVLHGEEFDLMDPAPLHAQKLTAALEALAKAPLPAAEVAALALRRESFLAALAAEDRELAAGQGGPPVPLPVASPAPTPAPSAAPTSTPAPTAAPSAASASSGKPPAPPAIPGNAATDQRLSGRFASFMKRASDHRKSTGVPNADEAYLNRINAWARVPGLTSFAKPIGETERQVTAPVMELLEAGLAAWIAETTPVGAGK